MIMTFMDDFSTQMENAAFDSTRQLMVWLGTISPVSNPLYIEILQKLEQMAVELQWPAQYDEQLGYIIPERTNART